jgi:hypothetical protein
MGIWLVAFEVSTAELTQVGRPFSKVVRRELCAEGTVGKTHAAPLAALSTASVATSSCQTLRCC